MSGNEQAEPVSGDETKVINMAQLRDKSESTAFALLAVMSIFGWIILLFTGLFIYLPFYLIGRFIAEYWGEAYIKTNAIRVGPNQLPEVYQISVDCAKKLGLKQVPEVYVLQESIWNAMAYKVAGKRKVVLFSGAVDSILHTGNLRQLAWLIGHEIGHHAAGHLDWTKALVAPGNIFIWFALWYSRRREFTCDRIGLYCAGCLESSKLAVVNMTVGSQLAANVNVAEAVRQWEAHKKEFFVRYRTLYSTHPHNLVRLKNLEESHAELDMAA